MSRVNWANYRPYFTQQEFACKHTGKEDMNPAFMDILMKIRRDYGKPLVISSGYRHPTHPIEAAKQGLSGEHTLGTCCDVRISGADAVSLITIALIHGITRFGVSQKGDPATRFLHLGIGGGGLPNPTIWSY